MGGTNEPSNLVELTVEEHADAHKKLYEKHGLWQDYLAWKCLSGQISKQEIQKIKSYQGGILTPKKKIAKYNKEGFLVEIYDSVKSAAEQNNTYAEHISQVANDSKLRTNIHGFRYLFFEINPIEKIKPYRHGLSKEICMFDLDENLIKIFESTVQASEETGLRFQNISQCALGKIKTCGGFIWRYKNASL